MVVYISWITRNIFMLIIVILLHRSIYMLVRIVLLALSGIQALSRHISIRILVVWPALLIHRCLSDFLLLGTVCLRYV